VAPPDDRDAEFRLAVQDLVDKQELRDLVARLHRGVDRLDDELIVSCLARGFRYGIRVGMTPEEFARNARRMSSDDYMGTGARLVSGQHTIANQLFEIVGDAAYGETYARFYGFTDDGAVHTMIMRYIDRYTRTAEGWKLIERDPTVDWASPQLEEYAANFPRGRRDRNDISYRRAV
jgi:hypothetical protein